MPNHSSSQLPKEEQLIKAIRTELRGFRMSEDFDIGDIAKRMVSVVPREQAENRLAQKVGPFYNSAGIQTWLGISRQAIQKRREARTILGCFTADRRWIYPVWQFQENGELLPGLPKVLRVLAGGIEDGCTWGLWL